MRGNFGSAYSVICRRIPKDQEFVFCLKSLSILVCPSPLSQMRQWGSFLAPFVKVGFDWAFAID